MWKKSIMFLITIMFIIGFSGIAQAETVRAAGATIVQSLIDKLAKPFTEKNPAIIIETAAGGSTVGITSGAEGAVNIGLTARPLTPAEARVYPNAKLITFAKDGIAVVVHPANPVTGLTSAQAKDIFAGKLADWGPLGGSGAINVVIRERGSGTRVAFEGAIMGEETVTGMARIGGSTSEMKRIVAADPGAIGYVVLGAVDASLKALTLDNKAPTIDNVKAGIYTLAASFYMVTDGEPTGATKTFIDFVLGPEGQALVEREKLVPVGPTK